MRKNIFLVVLAAFLGGACLTANTQQRNSMPTPNSPSDPFVAPTPYVVMPPTTEQVDEVVKDAVEKLGISKTRLTTLAEQPSEIVASGELEKWKEYITDTEMVNGRYKFNKCRLVSGKKEKIVPCPE